MTPVLAAGALPPFLTQLVVLLAASVGIAYLCYRVRLVPIVGFLLAGALIGPKAMGLVSDETLVAQMAEVGVMLLLFSIGVEFNLARLARMSRAILIGGGVQVGLVLVVVTGILVALGVEARAAVFTAGLVALSSTAIVLSLLAESSETDTPSGQTTLAILLFQDFAVIAMVLVLPLLAPDVPAEAGAVASSSPTLDALWLMGRALLVVALVAVGARKLVPAFLERIAATRRHELFLLAVVAVCFGTAALVAAAGVSMALGAFLAGLVVSESRHSEQALADILPLRTVFNAVFFVSVGMLLDIWYVIENPLLVVAVALSVLAIKTLTTGAAVAALGYPVRIGAPVALGLAQIGEFSFVLAQAGALVGLYPAGDAEGGNPAFIAVTVVLMVATPFLVKAGPRLGDLLAATPLGRIGTREPEMTGEVALTDHAVVLGYGPAGQRLADALLEVEIPFVIVEMNPVLHAEAEASSGAHHAIRGDIAQRHILEHAGVEGARLVVIVVSDPAVALRSVVLVRAVSPSVLVVVRTRFFSEVDLLRTAGADIVIAEELETSMRLVTQTLGAFLVPAPRVDEIVRRQRQGDYRILRDSIQEAHLMVLQALDAQGLHTRAVRVADGSEVAGKTIAVLDLKRRFDLHVLVVQRPSGAVAGPMGSEVLNAGDRLILLGPPPRFAEVAPLFRPAEAVEAG